jgi:hypothetical protein
VPTPRAKLSADKLQPRPAQIKNTLRRKCKSGPETEYLHSRTPGSFLEVNQSRNHLMMVPEPENDPFSQNAVCLLG